MKAFALNRPWLLGVATSILFLIGWQLTPMMGLIDAQLVPPATTVLNRFFLQWLDPTFYPDLLITILRVAGGFCSPLLLPYRSAWQWVTGRPSTACSA
jgi:ABC-type nitrate/sulfonate/bicarbonate transport system permease component